MTKILYGKPVQEHIKQTLLNQNKQLTLCTVGFDDPEWNQYTSSLEKSATAFRVNFKNYRLEKNVDSLFSCIKELANDENVNGIMVQQPLKEEYAFATKLIPSTKDVDCLSENSTNSLYQNKALIASATPSAVLELLKFYQIPIHGKHVVIIGRGNAVGKPLALLMLNNNATVTVCHSKTENLPSICRTADILVSCCGVANLVDNSFVNENTVVIDVGLSFVNGKMHGDVDVEKIQNICKAYSPVPGGIGPVTRACIFANLLKLANEN